MKILNKYRALCLRLAAGTGIFCVAAAAGAGIFFAIRGEGLALRLAGIETAAGGDVTIAVHKALYDFKMISADVGSAISGIEGKMYFEQDATCDAWTTEHRFTSEYHYAERPSLLDTSHYVAYESMDQQQFSFSSERQENGEMTERLRGAVERAPDGMAQAVYSRPEELKYDLPKGYLLPTTHTMEIIRHARAGENFFSAVLFDGTDADGPVEVGTFIGKKATAEELQKITAGNTRIDAALLTPDAWHIRLAVFPLKETAESMPSYEMEMIMHDNGVVSRALVDHKIFTIEQSLAALEKLPAQNCE